MMKRRIQFRVVLIILIYWKGSEARRNVNPVDNGVFRPVYRMARDSFFNFIGSNGGDQESYLYNLRKGKVQKPFKDNDKFFCDPKGPGRRSAVVPNSVHELTPGDIDIIAGIGDSLTAGNGAMAMTIFQILMENKGLSWSIGGHGDWRKFLTIPNIIKEFNPNLYGYSGEDSLSYRKNSKFNVAEIGAMSRDMPYMTKILIKRMKNDPRVDINKHWKLVTMMIGANDICSDICYVSPPEKAVDLHEKHLLQVLRTLRDNLPRTMVNIVPPPNVYILTKFTARPMECVPVHIIECPCMFASQFQSKKLRFKKIISDWSARERAIIDREEFHNKTDFTVNYQPFTNNLVFPRTKDGITDYTYLSTDCFHLSQKGYAIAANALWNNMLQPYDNKTDFWFKEFQQFKCPTEEMPFLRTKENS